MADKVEIIKKVPEAKEIYVLMQNEYRISRNIRAQWFLNHLNKVINITPKHSKEECKEEIEVISAIPNKVAPDSEHFKQEYVVSIVPETKINFLSTRYRLVFCLDLSPSVATVDVQNGVIFFDEVYPTLRQSLESVCCPFIVPGSVFSFQPQLHITIIAYIPNCPSGVPQVLVQGWILTSENVSCLLENLKNSIGKVAERVAKAIAKSNEEYEKIRVSPDCIPGSVIGDGHDRNNKLVTPHHVLTSEISTVLMLRNGILALLLLPENSSAGIVVITDGIIGFPSTEKQDNLLAQLRNNTTSCSFLQVGSSYHPFSCFGRIPYVEWMQFISAATCGAYFPSIVDTKPMTKCFKPNAYHKAFLFWSFQTTQTPNFLDDYKPTPLSQPCWTVDNPHFYTVAKQSRVKKKQISGTLKVSLENLLSCRLREGYTVKNVHVDEGKNAIEVRLHLPWNLSTNFEYVIKSNLTYEPRRSNPDVQKQSSLYELNVDGCYEFLHDVTCSDKKPIKSTYRNVVIGQFWSYIKTLSQTDQILVQLHSFKQNPAHYLIPDAIKNGVPLFCQQGSNSITPVLPSSALQSTQFMTFWKPLCMLNINVWQKWMHTHRIGIILQHDMPLPKNLHLPNSSGRYAHIQYRHAVTALYTLLSDYCSFVLVENQFYIRFLYNEPDKPPTSFYVIQVTSKGACIVIRLAFLGGLPGFQRNQIVKDVREQIINLRLHKRPHKEHSSQLCGSLVQSESHDTTCCFLLKKPVEKILIQYKNLPQNYLTSIIDNPAQSHCQKHTSCQLTEVSTTMMITLSKYFHHQRWVWSMQRAANNSMSMTIVSKILSVLTKIRLQEGFHFICSNLGIIYMVLEIPMKVLLKDTDERIIEDSTCVVQYLLFPPHTNTTFKDSISEEEDSELPESDGELQLITECWVEPQYGVTTIKEQLYQLNRITYEQIPKVLFAEDSDCISILTTFEHLCQLCQKKENTNPTQVKVSASNLTSELKQTSPLTLQRVPSQATPPIHSLSPNISFLPYSFSLIKLLPKCHQTKLFFPTLNVAVDNGEDMALCAEPNELLFEQLISNIKAPHDQELLLSVQDSIDFLLQIHHRNQQMERNVSDAKCGSEAKNVNMNSNPKAGTSKSVIDDHKVSPLDSSTASKWKCFIKACSSSRFVITMLPSSYLDLKGLVPKNTESAIGSDSGSVPNTSNPEPKDLVEVESNEKEGSPALVSKQEDDLGVLKSPKKETPSYCSHMLMLPIYIYDCILSSVVTQLSDLNYRSDSTNYFESYNFKYEDSIGCDEVMPEKMDFTFDSYKSSKRRSSKAFLNSHRSLMDKSFSKSFVYAVYKSLVLNLPVDKLDVIAAIDEICEESFLEIDITDFVYTICGHLKDFMMKSSIKQIHLASGKNEDDKLSKSKEADDTEELNPTNEKSHSKTVFPLTLLKRHQPCEQLHQKHLDIKSRFTDVLGGFLKKIPSRPDYYVFQPVQELEELSISEETFPEIENPDTEDDLLQNSIVIKNILTDKDSSSNADIPEEDSSSNKHVNTQSSISSLDEDPDSSFSQKQVDWPPLFVHLLCSVKSKDAFKSCSMSMLPTCLGDIQECISPLCSEIDLDELRITLDVTCLTLPSDIQNPTVPDEGQYSTSFSSSSPVPESDQKKSVTPEDDIFSDVPTNTVQGCPLRNIPDFQRDGLYKCIDRIKWLLLDEKAAAALDSYPITSMSLDFVANHVKSAEDKSCCVVKEVPLKFVFGPESSVDKFIQVFKQMTLPGYRLNEVDSFYYLVLDAESAEKLNKQFSSLEPPLSTSAKYVLMQQNLHCNDCTELKKICDDAEIEKSFSHTSKGCELSGVEDDAKSLELQPPPPKHKLSFSGIRGKRKLRKVYPEEDTETEDGSEQLIGKNRTSRKSISKVATNRSPLQQQLCSLPSALFIEKVPHHRRSHSLPVNLHRLEQKDLDDLQSLKTSAKSNTSEPSWKPEASNYRRLSQDHFIDWGSEVPISSPSWDLPLGLQTAYSVSSAPSVAKSRAQEGSGSPHIFSDDYASVIGSYHYSNTEDGYDGDSSDTGSDWDWLSALDTKRPVLPKFWLIMTVDTSKVTIFFHIRHRKKDDEELVQSKAVLSQTISMITNICKEVNQTLLLQSLHETRMCNRLLVPEESEDIWKRNELDPVFGSSDPQRTFSDDGNPLAEMQEKYLEANLRFMPGTFNCDIVWVTHFRLHHRLTSNPNGSFMSRGIQALRTVLNTFSVNNRENMFVYQERSGSVFYLRLFEENCEEDHNFGKPQMESNLSPTGSYYFSCQAAAQRKLCIENDNESDFRPRVNSGQSDCDRQDSVSTISTSKNFQRCIALHVHGIGEVGTEIKVDLVQVLQNRLNEGVLDRIILMLSRNPHCKLTLEDVQFIQNPNQPPFSAIHFTIPVKILGYAHAIHIYLRQNMLHFLYNPKYMDSNRKETHFKAYSKNPIEWVQVEDNDIFIYHSQQASGYSGSKGIACIVLSLVTGLGYPFQHLGHSLPNPSAYQDGLSENDFEELTLTMKHELKKDRSPGPVALIRFQIWSVGKDSVRHIEQKLHDAVRHALWDLLMEYKVLTAPISEDNVFDDPSSYSEPSTPIRARRTGKLTDQILKAKDFPSPPIFQTTKEMSSSVPDIAAKSQSPQLGLVDAPMFQFNVGPKSAKPELCTGPSTQEISDIYVQDSDKCNLTYMFHSVMKPFLDFGNKLGCPAVSKHVFNLSSRHCVEIVLRETHNVLKTHCRDVSSKIFLRKTNVLNADTEFIPFLANTSIGAEEAEEIIPGTKRSFIIAGRNDVQWKAYMKVSEFIKFQETYIDTMKTYQKFQTHICNLPSEKLQDSTPNSPATLVRLEPIFSTSTPRVRSPTSSLIDSHSPQSSSSALFVPRQRLILILIQDKKLSMFLYNWSQDITNTFMKHMEKLVQWHDFRSSLLNNIIVQKLGLFHGQSFPKRTEKNEKSDKTEFGRKSKEFTVPVSWNIVEQLFQHHTVPRETQSSSTSVTTPKVAATTTVVQPPSPSILDILKNVHPPMPLHISSYSSLKDPLTKHGMQVQDIRNAQNKDMQELRSIWQTRGPNLQNDSIERLLLVLKRVCRLSHYCLTPILFSPSWRWKVAPVRDHTLKPLETVGSVLDKSPSESSLFSRSRHSSGSSLKNETTQSVSNTTRSRRTSGAAVSTANPSSPKPRLKNPSEEAWHQTVCNHYLKEYIQYLHTLGFVSLQTKEDSRVQGSRKSAGSDDNKYAKVSHARASLWGAPVFYLIRKHLGGLLLFEIGLCDPYAYAHLYTIECVRLRMGSPRALLSQFTCAFLDEVDKIKAVMHLHSFTFDYHLRTIHSYISGRQLIFRHGYHLTSFLDDFIKYYQKSPDCARNLLYAGSVIINDINMSGHQLYNYIISHNQLYGMTVLRMVPIMQDSSSMMDTEFVLVELSARKASYKDTNDVCQMGSFDIGLLINHNTCEISTDRNTLVLNYYIILTSQRELFPLVENYTKILGSFQTVRFATVSQNSSPHSSRKTSTASMVTEKDKLESSGEETSSSSTDSRSRRSAASALGITDEEVTYLGYFSNQETMMQEVLLTEAESSQTHLSGVFHRAAIHCRRDFLWSSLLPRATKEEESSRDAYSSAMSYTEFSELLNLVSSVPLDDIDFNLRTFLDMHILWYKALASTLKIKYHDSHREFRDADNNILYIAVTNNKCPDSFTLLSIDFKSVRAELCVVFREPPSDMNHTPDKPSQRVLALQALVEEFVNTCCFQIWSSIVS